jgi:hypothetical protein
MISWLVVALGPLALAVLSIPFAIIFGCEGGGGSPGTCSVGGDGMGDFVWTLAMMHWYTLMTFVPGLGIIAIGLALRAFGRSVMHRNE